MGPVRHLRTLAPPALVATLAAAVLSACGSGSSSSGPSAGPADQLQVRQVAGRHDPGASLGPQLPKALAATLAAQTCPTPPKVVDGYLLECDAGGSVFLLKDPIITGGIANATATHVGHQKLWYVKVDLTPDATAKMKAATASMTGLELAYSLGGKVLTTIPVDSQFDPGSLVVLGNYTEAQAQQLATRLAQS